ncbi:MAG: molybdate ABC transporter substrate-binding protein [Phyllobacteriaceae bacterium]|nr:molybdate ABC transporter substrate-binding protein [Phyllobacteriaceae bacterium]
MIFSFAASSALAKQIEAGAPADLFASADEDWMNFLAERRLILAETRRDIAGNILVIAAQGEDDAGSLLTQGKFAMGDPGNVPAGKYAKAALDKMHMWEKVKANAVFADNVRAALEFVRKGAAKAAIVYGSDLKAAPELKAAYTFDPATHAPIRYPAALTRDNPTARAFLEFLSSSEGQAIFAEWGFVPAGAMN